MSEKKKKKIRSNFYKRWDRSKPVLMEKSAHHIMRLEFWSKLFYPSKFIGVVRNGYAVTEGLMRKKKHPVDICSYHWNAANKIMMEDSKNVDFLLIKYEDLCSNTQKEMDTLCSFIGIKPIVVDFKRKIPRQNFRGKNIFFSLDSSPDFNSESISKLTPNQLKIIREESGEMLNAFGYAIIPNIDKIREVPEENHA